MAVGIRMENCFGGSIVNCTFKGLDAGIESINSSVKIERNAMEDCNIGVAFDQSSKLSASENTFVRVGRPYQLLQSTRKENIFDRLARQELK